MRITTGIPQGDLRRTVDAAKRIEAAGYDGVSTNENKHDPFLPPAVSAVTTDRLRLAPSVAIALPRNPLGVPNATGDLQQTSTGPLPRGRGSGGKGRTGHPGPAPSLHP